MSSQLQKAGFTEVQEWAYGSKRKGGNRRRYTKRLGNDWAMAYAVNGGFTFGIQERQGHPLCKKYGFARNIQEMNKKLRGWVISRKL